MTDDGEDLHIPHYIELIGGLSSSSRSEVRGAAQEGGAATAAT